MSAEDDMAWGDTLAHGMPREGQVVGNLDVAAHDDQDREAPPLPGINDVLKTLTIQRVTLNRDIARLRAERTTINELVADKLATLADVERMLGASKPRKRTRRAS